MEHGKRLELEEEKRMSKTGEKRTGEKEFENIPV